MFQYEAAKCYEPAGNNIFCTCYTEIEVGSATSATASVTNETEEQGSLWWKRKSKTDKKAASAKKKAPQRRRVTCPNTSCGVSFTLIVTMIIICFV